MGISIDKLQFDPSAPADNQRVGSFLIGAGGAVITETGTALDVNISNASIVVSGTDIDIRNLVFADDKVDVSGSEVSLDSATLAALENITVSGTVELGATTLAALENITVSATDLDIRDLTQADEITVFQGTSPWIISGTDIDIRDLDFAQDSIDVSGSTVELGATSLAALEEISVIVEGVYLEDAAHVSGDKGSFSLNVRSDIPAANTSASGDYAAFQSDNKGRLWVNDAANAGQSYGALSITSTAAEFLGAPLSGRKLLLLQNLGSQDVYIGFNGSVTSANGLQLAKYSSIELPFGDNLDIFMVTASGTADVRYVQLA